MNILQIKTSIINCEAWDQRKNMLKFFLIKSAPNDTTHKVIRRFFCKLFTYAYIINRVNISNFGDLIITYC